MAGPKVIYAGGPGSASETDRDPSPIIWKKFKRAAVAEDPALGGFWWDDFLNFGGTVTTNVGTYYGYKSYEVTSGSIQQAAAKGPTALVKQLGVIRLLTPASTSAACVAMEAGYGNGGSYQVNGNTNPKLFFEARIQYSQVAGFDSFIGLLERGGAANNFLFNSSDVIQTKSFLGFYTLTAAPTTIRAAHGDNGDAAVVLGSGTVPSAATTWTKLGFVYDPDEQNRRRFQMYQDGTLLGYASDCSISTFPTADPLTPCIIVQNDTTGTAANSLHMDWWMAGQLF